MQRVFFIEYEKSIDDLNNFLGTTGKVISVTPQKLGGEGNRGKIFVVADDGEGENVKL